MGRGGGGHVEVKDLATDVRPDNENIRHLEIEGGGRSGNPHRPFLPDGCAEKSSISGARNDRVAGPCIC